MPLLGCHCSVPLLGAVAGCHCWGAIAGCLAACHCEKPLREKIDQSVTPFSAALFSALITHKNWLVLSRVYAGKILLIIINFFKINKQHKILN